MYRIWNFVTEYSALLIGGALAALVWANIDPTSYRGLIDMVLVRDFVIGHAHLDAAGHLTRDLTVHFLINDVLMALFFAIAGKEVWEAVILREGALRGKKAVTPLIATLGGMTGPVLVYLGLAALMGGTTLHDLGHGWAVPTATDIAFSYLVGRLVFGAGHPAVRFLLLLAIADDAGGLLILAVFYPSGEVAPVWLLLSLGAALGVFVLANWLPRRLDRGNQRRPASSFVRRALGFWPYALAGAASWYGFQQSGLHPALGLLPIIPTIPHADRAFGLFAEQEVDQPDLLNHIEHGLKLPVEFILFLFGLANAGVALSDVGAATALVLFGLLIGKPLGIFAFGWTAAYPLRFGLPVGMRTADLAVLGCVAAIGFTVALFVASVAFVPGAVQDAAKMGAVFSFAATAVSLLAGRLFAVERRDA